MNPANEEERLKAVRLEEKKPGSPWRSILDKRGFVRYLKGGRTALVLEDGAEEIRAALLEGAGCVPVETEGRGRLMRFRYQGGHGLVRKYWRGGAVRHLFKDRYLLENRPLRELRLHCYIYDKGLSVPKPLGVCWERSGIWFRGAIATVEVDAANLLAYLRSGASGAEETLRNCGALIRRMHDLGVFHADLQVRNILVGAERPFLIDFDRARVSGSLGSWSRARNLLRLRRSFQKCGLPELYFRQLCDGYGTGELPHLLDWLYSAKGSISDMFAGRR